MQKIAIIQISEEGKHIARLLLSQLKGEIISRQNVGKRWHDFDAFVFIGAMGICVRTIAPCIADKHSDPAVVCVDSLGLNAISVLSGHVGGANDLTRKIAALTGAREVITTQSDNAGLWALDTMDRQFGWTLSADDKSIRQVIINFVNLKPTAVILDIRDEGTDWMESTRPNHVDIYDHNTWMNEYVSHYAGIIIVSPRLNPYHTDNVPTIRFAPKVLTVGFGLAHQASPADAVIINMGLELSNNGLDESAIKDFATIDIKRDEPVVRNLSEACDVHFYTADQLSMVEVPTPSHVVSDYVGTPSVCEAAAILASNGGELLLAKQKDKVYKQYTIAVAINRQYLRGQRSGHIEIVGAGPGAPDLISVRGRKMLERADLILYAGSLVPKALTDCHKPGAVVRSSAPMTLEEQCQLMKEHYDRGHFIVRLHTGDPCIFGAIEEQMAFFDEHGMDYHITPGISSFLAAAAELRSQFTIPEQTQTIILTRGEGRTPMPEKEQLHLLARSQSTMCIFLSAAIVDDVQRELLMEYPEDTPVAACYHLTWPDQQIYRGKLKDLARIVHDNHLTLTTMLVVGEAIDNRQGLSELYSSHFTHLFRQGCD